MKKTEILPAQIVSEAGWLVDVIVYPGDEINWQPKSGPIFLGELRLQLADGQWCLLRPLYVQHRGLKVFDQRDMTGPEILRESILQLLNLTREEIQEKDFVKAAEYVSAYEAAVCNYPGLSLAAWCGNRSEFMAGSSYGPYWWVTKKWPTKDVLIQRLLSQSEEARQRVWIEGYDCIEIAEEMISIDNTSNDFTRIVVGNREELVVATLNGLVILTRSGSGRFSSGPLVLDPIDFAREQAEESGYVWEEYEMSWKTQHNMWWDGTHVHTMVAQLKD